MSAHPPTDKTLFFAQAGGLALRPGERRMSVLHGCAAASALEDELRGRVRFVVAQLLLKLLGRDRSAVVVNIAGALQFTVHGKQRVGADRAAAVAELGTEDARFLLDRASRLQRLEQQNVLPRTIIG